MTTLQFPTLEDRTNVHTLINHYTHKKITLTKMMTSVARIVEQYKVSKFPVFDYSVKVICSRHSEIPIISIDSARISDNCPTCESDASGYLRTEQENLNKDYDIASFTCLDCGCVYMSKQDNGRKSVVYK